MHSGDGGTLRRRGCSRSLTLACGVSMTTGDLAQTPAAAATGVSAQHAGDTRLAELEASFTPQVLARAQAHVAHVKLGYQPPDQWKAIVDAPSSGSHEVWISYVG